MWLYCSSQTNSSPEFLHSRRNRRRHCHLQECNQASDFCSFRVIVCGAVPILLYYLMHSMMTTTTMMIIIWYHMWYVCFSRNLSVSSEILGHGKRSAARYRTFIICQSRTLLHVFRVCDLYVAMLAVFDQWMGRPGRKWIDSIKEDQNNVETRTIQQHRENYCTVTTASSTQQYHNTNKCKRIFRQKPYKRGPSCELWTVGLKADRSFVNTQKEDKLTERHSSGVSTRKLGMVWYSIWYSRV